MILAIRELDRGTVSLLNLTFNVTFINTYVQLLLIKQSLIQLGNI